MRSTKRWTMLGALARSDQRAAQCTTTGSLYLFDESGGNPDQTDDGPLRFDPTRPIAVGMRNVEVPVWTKENEEKHLFVTHAGLLRMVQLLQRPPGSAEHIAWPFRTFELKLSPDAVTMMSIGRTGTKINAAERRVRTNVGPWDDIPSGRFFTMSKACARADRHLENIVRMIERDGSDVAESMVEALYKERASRFQKMEEAQRARRAEREASREKI